MHQTKIDRRAHRAEQGCRLLLVSLLVSSIPAFSAIIDPAAQSAWNPAIGWCDHAEPMNGVTVYTSHLEGYAYNTNVGWIRFGTHTGGDDHTYLNTTAANYGVNNDSTGKLSGYAWSPSVGWIDFNPLDSGVRIDPSTGIFSGCAYNANVGWISFSGTSTIAIPYEVASYWQFGQTALIDNGSDALTAGERGVLAGPNPVSLSRNAVEIRVTTRSASFIKMSICDALGNTIDVQSGETTSTGAPHHFTWDLRNGDGRIVEPGSYLAIVQVRGADGAAEMLKAVIGVTP